MASSLTRYQPRTSVTRLPDLMDRLFQESFVLPTFFNDVTGGSTRPSLPANLYETGNSYVVQVSLPGINPDGLDIQVVGHDLTIKGRWETHEPDNVSWIWRGIPTGEFYETFTLPMEIDREKVEASYDHGILSITLPKEEHALPKNVKVSVGK